MVSSKHKLIVPIDLGPPSLTVANYALAIAERYHMHVVFVYVGHYAQFSTMEEYVYIEEPLSDIDQLIQAYNEWSAHLSLTSATFEAVIKETITFDQLNDIILDLKISLVCICAKDNHTSNNFIAPSIISFITKCSVPVIVVPPQFTPKLHEEFVFFTNFRTDDIRSIERIQQDLMTLPRLHILHITNDFSKKKELEITQLKDTIIALGLFKNITHSLVASHSILHFIKEYIDTHPNTLAIIHMTTRNNWLQRLVQRSITKRLLQLPERPFVVV